ncbi:MAG: radical SAM protein [Syntrophales bacterium]|nr:radical SAM protein [Syntrophales bacterium]
MDSNSILLKGNGDFSAEQFLEVLRGDDESHLLLSLGLTTSPGCNMRCIYCYNEGGKREAGNPVTELMRLKDYRKVIKESAALGAQSVIMVGVGETMMDKNFRRIVELTSSHGMIPLVFTNGTLLDREMADFLFKHQASIYLALDSTREETFDIITRSKGFFSKVMRGIDHCLEAGFGEITTRNGYSVTDFAVNTMVMNLNADHLDEIEQFCREKDILFTCRFPEKLGTAQELWDTLISPLPEEEAKIRQLAEKHSLGNEVFRTDLGCLFWTAGLLLGVDGRARLCYSLNQRVELGNIKTEHVKDIIMRKRQYYPHREDSFCPIHLDTALSG